MSYDEWKATNPLDEQLGPAEDEMMPEPNDLPPEIQRVCDERVRILRERPGEVLPFDPLAELSRALLAECDRRYAAKPSDAEMDDLLERIEDRLRRWPQPKEPEVEPAGPSIKGEPRPRYWFLRQYVDGDGNVTRRWADSEERMFAVDEGCRGVTCSLEDVARWTSRGILPAEPLPAPFLDVLRAQMVSPSVEPWAHPCPWCQAALTKHYAVHGGMVRCENQECRACGPDNDPKAEKWNVLARYVHDAREARGEQTWRPIEASPAPREG